MSRLQLALNVADLDAAVDFYTDLFGVAPHKQRPGYANFAVADPPLKLVLFEAPEAADRINHLGIEVQATDEVVAARDRLVRAGRATRDEDATLCCHAVQDKVWTPDPDGGEWEIYTILDDEPIEAEAPVCAPGCCG